MNTDGRRSEQSLTFHTVDPKDWEWVTVLDTQAQKRAKLALEHKRIIKQGRIHRDDIRVSKPHYLSGRKHHAYLRHTNISLCGREISMEDRYAHYLSLFPLDCERCRTAVEKLKAAGQLKGSVL